MVREKIALVTLCTVLQVSRSGYYAWVKRPASVRAQQNQELIEDMKRIHEESRETYGEPRIRAQLRQDGKPISKGRVYRLMKIAGICAETKRAFKVMTTNSNHDHPIAPRHFKTEDSATHPTKPNVVWASDVSYIHTGEGFLYLATYLDLFTRKVVGFSTADHMKTDLLLGALKMGLGRQKTVFGELTGHSDRGVQYASERYREELQERGIVASMSRKGNCYDNAFAESFFASLKKELIYRTHYKTKEEAKRAIFEYIEVWYNRRRLHSALGYKSPVQFEESLVA